MVANRYLEGFFINYSLLFITNLKISNCDNIIISPPPPPPPRLAIWYSYQHYLTVCEFSEEFYSGFKGSDLISKINLKCLKKKIFFKGEK